MPYVIGKTMLIKYISYIFAKFQYIAVILLTKAISAIKRIHLTFSYSDAISSIMKLTIKSFINFEEVHVLSVNMA